MLNRHGVESTCQEDEGKMYNREFIAPLAQALYTGFKSNTHGVKDSWSDLDERERRLWNMAARRAMRKLDQLEAVQRIDEMRSQKLDRDGSFDPSSILSRLFATLTPST